MFTPDELFNQFTCIASTLPDDASTWPFTLCATYYSNLSTALSDRMANDAMFSLPTLTSLITKSLQMGALREVRKHAVRNWEQLEDQRGQLQQMILAITGNKRHGASSNVSFSNDVTTYNNSPSGNMLFQQHS